MASFLFFCKVLVVLIHPFFLQTKSAEAPNGGGKEVLNPTGQEARPSVNQGPTTLPSFPAYDSQSYSLQTTGSYSAPFQALPPSVGPAPHQFYGYAQSMESIASTQSRLLDMLISRMDKMEIKLDNLGAKVSLLKFQVTDLKMD